MAAKAGQAAPPPELLRILADVVVTVAAVVESVKTLEASQAETAARTEAIAAQTGNLDKFMAAMIGQYQELNARLDASIPNFSE